MNGDTMSDYTACGTHVYVARAVNDLGDYVDSAPRTVSLTIYDMLIAPADHPEESIQLEYRAGSEPTRSGYLSVIGGYTHYAGRNLPVYEFSDFEDETKTLSFSFRKKDIDRYNSLRQLIQSKKVVLCRTNNGEKYYGVIESIEYDRRWFNTSFDLNIRCVDYKEEIAYD